MSLDKEKELTAMIDRLSLELDQANKTCKFLSGARDAAQAERDGWMKSYEKIMAERRIYTEALKVYAGKTKEAEWDGVKFLTFNKFGHLDESIAGPFIAIQALAKGEELR